MSADAGRSRSRHGAARQAASSAPRSLVLPVMGLALGLALAVLGFPRLMAALHAMPAGATLQKLDRADRTLTPGELLGAREALRLSLLWEKNAGTSIDLARVSLALAAREFQAGGDPQALIDETITAARDGLAIAPARARSWLLLAEATLARSGDPGAMTGYLMESLRASPHDVWLAPHRAELGLQAWPWLEPPARAAIDEQIRLTASRSIERLVDIALRIGDPTQVREALAQDRDMLRRFDVLYLRRRG
ncbi:MAG: hypothetical protein AB7F36_08310 [Reyranellaceae bacterium]